MRATSLLLKADDPFMVKAIDGVDPSQPSTDLVNGAHRKSQPALYWPVVFGLAFEAAATSTSASDDPSAPATQAMETALMGLEALSGASVAGDVFEREDVFDEVCNLCYRLAGTESARSQVFVIRVVLQVAKTVGEAKSVEAKARSVSCLSSVVLC